MPKNVEFLEKKNCSPGAPPPDPCWPPAAGNSAPMPCCHFHFLIYSRFVESVFLALKLFYYFEKQHKSSKQQILCFCFFCTFEPIFHFEL